MIVLCSFMDGHHVAELQQRHIVAPSRARASKSNSKLTIWLHWVFLSVMTWHAHTHTLVCCFVIKFECRRWSDSDGGQCQYHTTTPYQRLKRCKIVKEKNPNSMESRSQRGEAQSIVNFFRANCDLIGWNVWERRKKTKRPREEKILQLIFMLALNCIG